jgi:predicted alpha/beta superfamily hydrolase
MQSPVRATLDQFTLPHPSGDGQLTISIAAPTVASPDGGVPVLYLVDGDVTFGIAAEIARILTSVTAFPAYYVVGIGYGASYADFLKLRTADLSPAISTEALQGLGTIGEAIGGERSGGAETFLTFLTDTLRPEMAARYPETVQGESILFGHSLGGLFAANALLTQPDAFSAFLISSPSLWWDDFSLLRKLPAFEARLKTLQDQPRVFVDVGGKEQDLPTSVPDGLGVTLEQAQAQIRTARMVDAATEFAESLGDAGVVSLRNIVFAEEDHVSVASTAILHGMRFALQRES